MLIGSQNYRTIWQSSKNPEIIQIIDQRFLPHKLIIKDLVSVANVAYAIKEMLVRGAPLIGVTAAYGIYIAALEAKSHADFDQHLFYSANILKATRPTAVNLFWAIDKMINKILNINSISDKIDTAIEEANKIANDDIDKCRNIGLHGFRIIEEIAKQKNGNTVNILTHCNAGWLATVDYGTATAPIYQAKANGIDLHIWIDETRPRNQGAKLTAWEMLNQEIAHTVIVDNAGGHLMQHGLVDCVIVGSDRTTANGDVANKIGTYLKALAAFDNNVPFYVALPSTTIDWSIEDGINNIPIEERNADEVKYIDGLYNNSICSVLVTPSQSPAKNFGFDVTPAKLITGLITERGISTANKEGLAQLFPDKVL